MMPGTRSPPPPMGKNFLIFMQFWGENWSNSVLAPTQELAPPLGNSGSAIDNIQRSLSILVVCMDIYACLCVLSVIPFHLHPS